MDDPIVAAQPGAPVAPQQNRPSAGGKKDPAPKEKPAAAPADSTALSPTARRAYGADSKGFPRTPLFPQVQNFAIAPDRTTITLGADGRANAPFKEIADSFGRPDFPGKDYHGDAEARAGLRVDSRHVGVAVEANSDAQIATFGVPEGRAMAAEAQQLQAEYNSYMSSGDVFGAWALMPRAQDLMNRAKDYELKLQAQGQLTVDTQIVGRLPLPDFGPVKDLMLSGKVNLHYVPGRDPGTDPGFPRFGHLMGRIDYTGDMHDANADDIMDGNAYWNSTLKATMPTSSFGAGFGLGIGSKITDHFRWGFSADNIAGYIPGKVETWQKRDNLAQGQPDFFSGYTKTGETEANVYRTFKPPTYRLSMVGVIPQSGTQIMFSETLKDADTLRHATFVGAQQPVGPVDLGLGYTYRGEGSHVISGGLGIHFTKDTTLRLGVYTDGLDPEKVRELGGNAAFELRL